MIYTVEIFRLCYLKMSKFRFMFYIYKRNYLERTNNTILQGIQTWVFFKLHPILILHVDKNIIK